MDINELIKDVDCGLGRSSAQSVISKTMLPYLPTDKRSTWLDRQRGLGREQPTLHYV